MGNAKSSVEEGRPRLLRRPRHLDHHPLAQGELRRARSSRSAATSARATTTRRSRRRRSRPAPASSSSRTSREEFVRDYCFRRSPRARSTRTTTCSAPRSRGRSSPTTRSRSRSERRRRARPRRTGKGNDQVRFELTYGAFAPHLKVIAPWREWTIRSREDALDYARTHGVPVDQTKKDLFSRDRNLWHLSHEGGTLEDVWDAPRRAMFKLTVDPLDAPAQAAAHHDRLRARACRSPSTASASARRR